MPESTGIFQGAIPSYFLRMPWTSFLIFVTLLVAVQACSSPETDISNKPSSLKELYILNEWRQVDFLFDSPKQRKAMIQSGEYIPGNPIFSDVDYWEDEQGSLTFISMARVKKGTPATLATISAEVDADGSPLLSPYPDWSSHSRTDCNQLVSVIATKVDECNRLWVLDYGKEGAFGEGRALCPPKLVVFDLKTDEVLFTYKFPKSVITKKSDLVTIVVEVQNNVCDDSFAYIADASEFALVVVDYKQKTSSRVVNDFFKAYEPLSFLPTNGGKIRLLYGIFGLAVSPILRNGDRTLFVHSLSSLQEGKISTNLLKNSSNFQNGQEMPINVFLSREIRPSQSLSEDTSSDNVLFFGLLDPPALGCLNANLPLKKSNVVTVAQDSETLQFPVGIKVATIGGQEAVLVGSSKYSSYLLGTLNRNGYNNRILGANVRYLVENTLCDPGLN